jgi:hypothetical protein
MNFHNPVTAGAFLVLSSLVSFSASADEWTYTYTGQPFTSVNQPFQTTDKIDFQFTTTTPLGDNLVDSGVTSPILSWSLSLGPLSYSSATPDSVLYSINFSTDATGNIIGYQFTTQTNVVAPGLLPAEYPPTPYQEEVFSFNLPGLTGVADGIYIPSIYQDSYYAANSGTPGTWTVSSVPLPPAISFFTSGLLALGFLRKKVSQA